MLLWLSLLSSLDSSSRLGLKGCRKQLGGFGVQICSPYNPSPFDLASLSTKGGVHPAAWNSRIVLCHVDPNHTICEDLRSCSIISISLLNQPLKKHKKKHSIKKNECHLSTLHTYIINIILISNHTIPGILHPQSTAPHQKFQNHSNHSTMSRTPTWRLQFKSSQVEAVDVFFSELKILGVSSYPQKLTWNLKMVVSKGNISCSQGKGSGSTLNFGGVFVLIQSCCFFLRAEHTVGKVMIFKIPSRRKH